MTFLRSLLFNAIFFPVSAIVAVAGLLLLAAPPSWMVRYVHLWAKGVLVLLRVVCGIRVALRGRGNLPDGPAIIASNHQSAFDTIVWIAILPRAVYVLKKELLSIPVWAMVAQRCGHIAVDRAAGGKAMRGLVREAKAMLAQGRPIVIFPEGTRSAPGEHLPFQPGVAGLATLGAPVIPVATDSGVLWGRRAFSKRPGTITLAIMPALPASLPRKAMMDELRATIEREADALLRPARDPGGVPAT